MNLHRKRVWILVACSLWAGCTAPSDTAPTPSLAALVADLPALEGRPDYRASPYVTAGDRVYMVGHQDGQFPDLGWHVEGEMGGIWDHPIKLMHGFVASFTGLVDLTPVWLAERQSVRDGGDAASWNADQHAVPR